MASTRSAVRHAGLPAFHEVVDVQPVAGGTHQGGDGSHVYHRDPAPASDLFDTAVTGATQAMAPQVTQVQAYQRGGKGSCTRSGNGDRAMGQVNTGIPRISRGSTFTGPRIATAGFAPHS